MTSHFGTLNEVMLITGAVNYVWLIHIDGFVCLNYSYNGNDNNLDYSL